MRELRPRVDVDVGAGAIVHRYESGGEVADDSPFYAHVTGVSLREYLS